MREDSFAIGLVIIWAMIMMIMVGVTFHQQGKNKIRKEAVERGYGTYDNDNGKSSIIKFKWKDEAQK